MVGLTFPVRQGAGKRDTEAGVGMTRQVLDGIEERNPAVRADLAQTRLEDCWRRRADWAGRLRALLEEEEALDALERSLIEELAPGLVTSSPQGGEIGSGTGSFREVVHAFERRLIVQALEACGGVQRDAASMLGISATTLNEKLKRLGLRGHHY